MTVVVAAEHADVGPRSPWSGPFRPTAVILHVEAARRRVVAGNLVHALPEFGIRIRVEAGAEVVHPDPDDTRLYRRLSPAYAATGEAVELLRAWRFDEAPSTAAVSDRAAEGR